MDQTVAEAHLVRAFAAHAGYWGWNSSGERPKLLKQVVTVPLAKVRQHM